MNMHEEHYGHEHEHDECTFMNIMNVIDIMDVLELDVIHWIRVLGRTNNFTCKMKL